MAIDKSKFKELDSSSEEIHPNIERNTWIKLRKDQKQEKKKLLQEELSFLESKSTKSDLDLVRIEEISAKLRPKLIEIESSVCSNQSESAQTDFLQPLLFLMTHNSLNDFINLIDDNNYDLGTFEEYCLFNLAENIKMNNEDEARILSRIALYFKFAIRNGKSFIKKLNSALVDDKIYLQFEKEVDEFYLTCKENIMNLNKK